MTQAASSAGSFRWRMVAAVAVGVMVVSLVPLVVWAQPEPVENPADACPDEVNPPAPFTDRLQIPEVHRLNVDCAFNNDIALGFADQTFRASTRVFRDQFASFMVRTLRAAEVDLPAASNQGFTDISGNVHEDNINVLAATGITAGTSSTTYSPSLELRRDQIASFILRAAAFIEDVPLENIQRDSGPFTDVPATNVHARNINGARALNLTIGRTAGTYDPATATRRDQMASFLVRLLAALREGPLIPAEDRAQTLELTPATATNPVGTQHTLTATVRDDEEALLADANVRFEVYRDTGEGVFTGPVEEGMQRTDAQGQSGFAYTGPGDPAEDVIVACAVRPNETCAVVDADAETEGIQFSGDPDADARVFDVATKTWIEPPPVDQIELGEGELDAVNPLGEPHTLTATARDADGTPVTGALIRFEVYRAATAADTFSGPVESATVTTGGDGVASFTYSHDAEAVDRIVICVPVEGSCQVTDTDAETAGIQFTGDPVVGAEPNIVATKTWRDTVAADSLTASAFGLNVNLLGSDLVERLPNVAIELPPPDDDEQTDSVLVVPLNPLADAAVLEVAARGDLGDGFAQGEARAAGVEVLPQLIGDALITADAIHVFSTSTCPDPGSFEEATAGSQFVNLTVAGIEVPLNPAPNTTLEIPGVATVVVNEVIPDEGGPGHGFTVRGLRVTLLDGTGEVIVAEAHSSVVCADTGNNT